MPLNYQSPGPTREEIDAARGPLVLEFGTAWCGHCQLAVPAVEAALAEHPGVPHIQVEDGPGRRLGRSYRVKLWPTLVVLRDGEELARVVRPTTAVETREVLAMLNR